MAYTTNQLISGAYYASGVVSREFETVSGSQIADGLQWLNDILSEKRVDDGMVPYETVLSFNAVIGQKVYFIPNLTKIDTLVFYLDQVRYAMVYTKRNEFFGSPRVENIQTLPFEWYFERKVGGGNLHIYFAPDKNYPMEIHGIFDIGTVSLGQDLAANITEVNLGKPTFYQNTPIIDSELVAGQLVINGFDMQGLYPDIGAFTNYINSGIIPGVKAKVVVNDVVIYSDSEPPVLITVQGNGYAPNGTRFINDVSYIADSPLPACTYTQGNPEGVGATLIANANGNFPFFQAGEKVLITAEVAQNTNGLYTVVDAGSAGTPWSLVCSTNYDQAVKVQIGDIFTETLSGKIIRTYVQTALVDYVGLSPMVFEPINPLTFSNISTIQQSFYGVYPPTGFDEFYRTYLRYALADRICSEYNYDTPQNVMRQLSKYEAFISKRSRLLDLQMKKVSTLQKRGSFNYAFCNLGKGWTRPY